MTIRSDAYDRRQREAYEPTDDDLLKAWRWASDAEVVTLCAMPPDKNDTPEVKAAVAKARARIAKLRGVA